MSGDTVAVIGGGPAGLMAAETLAALGAQVHVFDAMPSVARKFLLAGKGGLNLTHSEPHDAFASRYGAARPFIEPPLQSFGADALRAWARELGVDTFVGTSGRVFPAEMKAAPLLRAWLHRLRHPAHGAPVQFHMRHRWTGWSGDALGQGRGALAFQTPAGPAAFTADATVLALGGASWPRLGSDGAWVPLLQARGVDIAPLRPANCGFDTPWTEYFRTRFAGQPFKSVAIAFTDSLGHAFHRKGEFVATATGIEGSVVYAASALLRDEIARHGHATLLLDLLPDKTAEQVRAEVAHPRGSRSLSSHLKSRLGIDGIKSAVLHEALTREQMADPQRLAAAIKALPLRLTSARPIAEAISSAGGVVFGALDGNAMLRAASGVFCAGEMLDWEAPTGGYLLTACFATGRAAGEGAMRWLAARG